MEVIYIDSLFLLNLVIDYVLTVMCAQVCGVRLRRRRYAFAALAGAVYAVAVYLPGLGWLKSAPFRLAAGALMALIAFAGEERPMRCAVVFFAVAAAFGGFIWAIALAGGYPAFDMRTLVAAFALCYALLRIVFSRRVKLADQARVQVSLTLGARRSEFVALVDTGNSLTDPISAMPVMVICPPRRRAASRRERRPAGAGRRGVRGDRRGYPGAARAAAPHPYSAVGGAACWRRSARTAPLLTARSGCSSPRYRPMCPATGMKALYDMIVL